MPYCPFWKAVEGKLRRVQGEDASLERLDLSAEEGDSFERANVALLRAASAVSGKSIFVDSSKGVARLQRYLACSDLDVRVIHLLRHPLAVAASYKRKGHGGLGVIRSWQQIHAGLFRLLHEQQARAPVVTLRYEDFVDEPQRWLSEITQSVGLPFEKSQVEYYKTSHHIPSGNRLRLSLNEQQSIRPDNRWVEQATLAERMYLWFTGRGVLSRLGYEVATSDTRRWVVAWQRFQERGSTAHRAGL